MPTHVVIPGEHQETSQTPFVASNTRKEASPVSATVVKAVPRARCLTKPRGVHSGMAYLTRSSDPLFSKTLIPCLIGCSDAQAGCAALPQWSWGETAPSGRSARPVLTRRRRYARFHT